MPTLAEQLARVPDLFEQVIQVDEVKDYKRIAIEVAGAIDLEVATVLKPLEKALINWLQSNVDEDVYCFSGDRVSFRRGLFTGIPHLYGPSFPGVWRNQMQPKERRYHNVWDFPLCDGPVAFFEEPGRKRLELNGRLLDVMVDIHGKVMAFDGGVELVETHALTNRFQKVDPGEEKWVFPGLRFSCSSLSKIERRTVLWTPQKSAFYEACPPGEEFTFKLTPIELSFESNLILL